MKTGRTQQERIAASRRAIVDATLVALATRGYQATTFASIAADARLSRGGLLHHFQSKRDLVAGALEHAIEEQLANIDDGISALADGPSRTLAAVDLLYEVFHSTLFYAAVAAQVGAWGDTEMLQRITPIFDGVYQHIDKRAESLFGSTIAAGPEISVKLKFAVATIRGMALLDTNTSEDRDHAAWAYIRLRIAEEIDRP